MKTIALQVAAAFLKTIAIGLAFYLLIYVGQNRGWLPFKATTKQTK